MSDVIAAVSTGNTLSAIGILRLSGDGCAQVCEKVFTCRSGKPLSQAPNRKLILGDLHDSLGRVIDNCMAVYTRGPNSYTGEDTVEFHCHGSPAVLAAGLEALYGSGARPARRGEFTKRAFLNGRMDLTQAEAVIDLIEAETAEAAANAAGQVGGTLLRKLTPVYDDLTDLCSHFHAVLDYPDEDIDDFRLAEYDTVLAQGENTLDALLRTCKQGRILKNGIAAAIVGKPNVGKSSLLNALAGFRRAIVTDIPGTTRDMVEQSVQLGELRLRLMDTAGIHATDDPVEKIGVERSFDALEQAELILFVCDASHPLDQEDRAILDHLADRKNVIGLLNKCDLGQAVTELPLEEVIPISAKEGSGLERLSQAVADRFAGDTPCDGSVLTNVRQSDAITRAREALGNARQGLSLGFTPDAVLTDVEQAMNAIGEVTGATVRKDITDRIFQRFCVGK